MRLAIAMILVGLGSSLAHGASISVFNTGQGLADGATDTNYTLLANPDGTGSNSIVQDSTAFPIVSGPWFADTASARWIGPRFNTAPSAAGLYDYQTTFTLPANVDLSSVTLSGSWAFDDGGNTGGILLNGGSIAGVNPGFGSLTAFSTTSGFVVGVNTLDFIGTNTGSYTGLLVSGISGSYNVVPEPGSVVLLGLGGVGLILAARRRRA